MNASDVDAFGLAMWFGATAPLVFHVTHRCFPGTRTWIRFVVSAAGVFGVWGIAGTFGSRWTDAYAFGMAFGAAIYGLCVWTYRRNLKANEK